MNGDSPSGVAPGTKSRPSPRLQSPIKPDAKRPRKSKSGNIPASLLEFRERVESLPVPSSHWGRPSRNSPHNNDQAKGDNPNSERPSPSINRKGDRGRTGMLRREELEMGRLRKENFDLRWENSSLTKEILGGTNNAMPPPASRTVIPILPEDQVIETPLRPISNSPRTHTPNIEQNGPDANLTREELAIVRSELKAAKSRSEDLEEQLRKSKNECKALSDLLESSALNKADQELLQQEIADLKSQNSNLENEIANLKSAIAAKESEEKDAETSPSKEELQELQETNEGLKHQLTKEADSKKALQDDVERLTGELDSSKSAVADLTNMNENLQKANAQLQEVLDQYKKDLSSMRPQSDQSGHYLQVQDKEWYAQQLEDMSRQVDILQSENEEFNQSRSSIEEQYDNLLSQLEAAKHTAQVARSSESAALEEAAAALAQVEKSTETANKKSQEASSARKEAEEATKRADEAQKAAHVSKLEADRSAADRQVAEARASQLQLNLDATESRLTKTIASLTEKQSELGDLKGDLAERKRRLAEAETQINELQTLVTALRAEQKQQQSERTIADKQAFESLKMAKSELSDKIQLVKNLESEISELKQRLAAVEEFASNQSADLKNEQSLLQLTRTTAAQEQAKLKRELEDVRASFAEADLQKGSLEVTVRSMQKSVESLNDALRSKDERVREVETSLTNQHIKLQRLEGVEPKAQALNDALNRADEARSQVDEVIKERNALQVQYNQVCGEARVEFSRLQGELDKASVELNRCRSKISELETHEQHRFQEYSNAVNMRHDALLKQKDQLTEKLQTDLTAAIQKGSDIEMALLSSQSEIAKLNARVTQLDVALEENSRLTRALDESQHALQDLRSKLTATESDAQRVNETLRTQVTDISSSRDSAMATTEGLQKRVNELQEQLAQSSQWQLDASRLEQQSMSLESERLRLVRLQNETSSELNFYKRRTMELIFIKHYHDNILDEYSSVLSAYGPPTLVYGKRTAKMEPRRTLRGAILTVIAAIRIAKQIQSTD